MNSTKRMSPAKLLRASALALAATAPVSAFACGAEPYISQVCTFAFDWCPRGYLKADGSIVNVSQYQALFGVIGYTYGGNNANLFQLPDLRGRVAVGTGISDYQVNTSIAQMGGSATVTLTANNLPPHVHPAVAPFAPGSAMNGPVSLPVSDGTISGQTISGSVTVNALNGDSSPGTAAAIPTTTANTVGKVGTGTGAFYPQGATPVAVPTTQNLAVAGGTLSGTTAPIQVKLPANNIGLGVTVQPNVSLNQPVPTVTPSLGLTACIAFQGVFPPRP